MGDIRYKRHKMKDIKYKRNNNAGNKIQET